MPLPKIYGCVNWATGKIEFDDCINGKMYGCIDWPYQGKLKLVLPGPPQTCLTGTYYGCVDWATGKFEIELASELCFMNIEIALDSICRARSGGGDPFSSRFTNPGTVNGIYSCCEQGCTIYPDFTGNQPVGNNYQSSDCSGGAQETTTHSGKIQTVYNYDDTWDIIIDFYKVSGVWPIFRAYNVPLNIWAPNEYESIYWGMYNGQVRLIEL